MRAAFTCASACWSDFWLLVLVDVTLAWAAASWAWACCVDLPFLVWCEPPRCPAPPVAALRPAGPTSPFLVLVEPRPLGLELSLGLLQRLASLSCRRTPAAFSWAWPAGDAPLPGRLRPARQLGLGLLERLAVLGLGRRHGRLGRRQLGLGLLERLALLVLVAAIVAWAAASWAWACWADLSFLVLVAATVLPGPPAAGPGPAERLASLVLVDATSCWAATSWAWACWSDFSLLVLVEAMLRLVGLDRRLGRT